MEESEFRQHVAQLGYQEPVTRVYEPNLRGQLHAHEFSASLLVLRGTFSLAFENESIELSPGETWEVPAGILHDERTGADGATILLARK